MSMRWALAPTLRPTALVTGPPRCRWDPPLPGGPGAVITTIGDKQQLFNCQKIHVTVSVLSLCVRTSFFDEKKSIHYVFRPGMKCDVSLTPVLCCLSISLLTLYVLCILVYSYLRAYLNTHTPFFVRYDPTPNPGMGEEERKKEEGTSQLFTTCGILRQKKKVWSA